MLSQNCFLKYNTKQYNILLILPKGELQHDYKIMTKTTDLNYMYYDIHFLDIKIKGSLEQSHGMNCLHPSLSNPRSGILCKVYNVYLA